MDNLKAPRQDELPDRRKRSRLGGRVCKEIGIGIQTITPILGGGTTARMLDNVDTIRVPTIRGHLRFWWRVLYGHQCGLDTQELYRRERKLWGGADRDGAIRSAVEIFTDCRPPTPSEIDTSEPHMQDVSSYGLWPARGQRRENISAAPRLKPGYAFDLRLVFSPVDSNTEDELRNVLQAWILFGGYGSRTRRGVGSITVRQETERSKWLPAAATRASLAKLFNGDDILGPVSGYVSSDMPSIRAGALIVGKKTNNNLAAWEVALGWLRDFRQGAGTSGKAGDWAREPDPHGGNRASVSNWPEADKIRQLSTCKAGRIWAHSPRYSGDPAWPRASFGLPIIEKFQEKSRELHPTRKKDNGKMDEMFWGELSPPRDEPKEFELRWVPNSRNDNDDTTIGSRLASPLIVKALPLADGQFVPCALWLNRAYPEGKVVLGRNTGGSYSPVPGSDAPFDKIAGATDKLLFNPLIGKTTVRQAFIDWLAAKSECTQVAP